MPNDADSLTEDDLDEPSESGEGSGTPDDTAAQPSGIDSDADDVTAQGSARAFDDDDWDEFDDDDLAEDDDFDWQDQELIDADFGSDFDLDGGERADAEPLLFEGEPDDFELDFGAPARPEEPATAGNLLVLDDPADIAPYQPHRMSRAEHRRRVRLQARRVRRIIRHIEPWSVLKISLFFYACLWVILLVAGLMIWGVAESSGTINKLEDLIVDLFALDEFTLDAGQIFRGYALGGLALAIAGTTFNVLMCLLFNLISDLTGGLRITMIEEETARPTPPRRARRRPPERRRVPGQRPREP